MSFTRKDIKNFIRNFNEASWEEHEPTPKLLSEGDCGCDGDETMMSMPVTDAGVVMGDPIMPETFAGTGSELAEAPCPGSYNKAIEVFIDIPHEVVEMLMPLMQDLEIDCPASLAKAMSDILMMSHHDGTI